MPGISDITFCSGIRFVACHADALVVLDMAAYNSRAAAAEGKGSEVMRFDAGAFAVLMAVAVGGLGMAGDAAAGARKRCDTPEMRRLSGWSLLVSALAAAGKTLQQLACVPEQFSGKTR